jgi:hypothetical protein
MARQAWRQAVVALGGLVVTIGCTPGPIAPRSADDKMTGVGASGGSDVRLIARDAAAPDAVPMGSDAAIGSPRGAGGGSGRAAAAADAGAGDAAAPAETPKLPRPAAQRDGAALDAEADAATARAPRPGEIVIDEILVNPAGDDLGREWIEITSLASEPVDLSQLHLATASTDVAAAAGTMAAGSLLLLGQSGDPTKNGGAPVSVAYGTKLILVNADGQLSICLDACASGVVLDTVSWGTLDADYTGHALVVDPTTKSFCPAAAPFGTGGSFGTPGSPNPPCVENVDGGSDGGSQSDVSVAD